jgi:hypothetical protein
VTTRKGDRAADLPPEVEQQLADMTAADWDVLVARLRAPGQAEASVLPQPSSLTEIGLKRFVRSPT